MNSGNSKYLKNLDTLKYFHAFEGLKAKLVHSDTQTFAFWEIDKDAEVPMHQHINEQTVIVTKGILRLTVAGEVMDLEPGMVVVIPPNTDHHAIALTEVEVLDVFNPIREDFPKE